MLKSALQSSVFVTGVDRSMMEKAGHKQEQGLVKASYNDDSE